MSRYPLKAQLRHRSREIALQLIYELGQRPDQDIEEAIALYPAEDEKGDVFNYACELVRGVEKNRGDILNIMRENVVGWRLERIVAVDRAAISIALYEAVITKSVPVPVAISEAVELAKAFGTDDSGRFVNGVLGKIVRKEPGSPE